MMLFTYFLIGASFVAGVSAFLAPRINAYLYRYTPQGRRNARSKKQLSSVKIKSEVNKKRDSEREDKRKEDKSWKFRR
jgi:hypothetical protein